MKPIVALVGRPNVGKSTLFNRMTKSRNALVDDFPGVTRDRHYADALWDEIPFTVVDTGGFLVSDDDVFAAEIREHVEMAVEEADVVVLVLDGRAGVSPFDQDLVHILRRSDKPVFYLINKIENSRQRDDLAEFFTLGMDKFFPVSAEHGVGVPTFMDALIGVLVDEVLLAPPMDEKEAAENQEICIAVAGRPNVGKSSLINRLFGTKRVVVSEKAGTTRDAIDLTMDKDGKTFRLIDTAGIRRKGKVREKIEKYSILKALKSLDRCDVALILVDASEGVTDQDITIAGYAHDRGCGAVFVLNKWDLLDKEEKNQKMFMEELRMKSKFLSFAPAITVSALTGQRTHKIFSMVESVYDEYNYRINTGLLNRIIENAIYRSEPSLHKGKRLKFFYATQVSVKPPTIVCFVNYPEAVHFSYKRYLINQIREMAELEKTPINLYFREKTGKMEFTGKTVAEKRYTEKKFKTTTRRKKARMEQQRRKRARDGMDK
ncbi:GTP-binding protein [Desulfocicer vacuolatum DSM 3385]|uniref:GTPase Der n=1 Tax=Desulfocicer vacuolatum DSM 3385 TaxID=1121400 RepID=A0A1W1YJC0_9BACT|nr:ribosome biogenesis GTPase Der [Desulfocicer vacuolatum]SMC36275.1 GTP-binding protein [Desulfocicer vacuolatum DSM 3385]